MKKPPSAIFHRWPTPAVLFCAFAAAMLAHCGDGSSSPVTPPTPAPTASPTPTPTPQAVVCNPTPPPLYGIRVTLRDASGYRKILAATPLVMNEDEYCGRVGFGRDQGFCETRMADDPLRAACDAAAVGRAADTGRPGPTWLYEGGPCAQPGNEQGCENHETDQFLAYAKGHGQFDACAAPNIPFEPPGSRCGGMLLP